MVSDAWQAVPLRPRADWLTDEHPFGGAVALQAAPS